MMSKAYVPIAVACLLFAFFAASFLALEYLVDVVGSNASLRILRDHLDIVLTVATVIWAFVYFVVLRSITRLIINSRNRQQLVVDEDNTSNEIKALIKSQKDIVKSINSLVRRMEQNESNEGKPR